jgi:small subunit ribosomal protein S13
MAYISNTNLKNDQKVRIALCSIYGIGKMLSYQICDELGISDSIKIKQLSNFQLDQLAFYINQNYCTHFQLKREIRNDMQRLVKIASYRGFRHTEGLPSRGQRTHGNAQTARKLKKKYT